MLDFESLRNYVHRMFLKKANFVVFINIKSGLKLPDEKSHTYNQLLKYAASKLGEKQLLNIIGLTDEKEAYQKIDLLSLIVLVRRYDLSVIAEKIDININHRMNRGSITRAILAYTKLNQLQLLFKKVAHKNFIVVIDDDGRILGPNWISYLCGDEDVEAARSFISFAEEIDESILFQIGRDVKITGDSSAAIVQKILTKKGSFKIFQIITNMIIEKRIDVEKLRGTYAWGIDIDSRYGMRYTNRSPVENLCDFFNFILSEEDFSPYLKHENWIYRDRVLAYCIENDPYFIINEHVGAPLLRKYIRNKLSIRFLPHQKRELINLLLFHFGFPIPKRLTGLGYYIENLSKWLRELQRDVDMNNVRGIAASAFIETEKILKDIIYFYCAYIVREGEQNIGYVFDGAWEIRLIEDIIKNVYPSFKMSKKTLSDAMFGEIVGILGAINKKSSSIKEINKSFNRKTIIPKHGKILSLLNEINPYRKYFVHDVKVEIGEISKKTVQDVLKLMLKLSNEIREIYPIPIKALKIETRAFRSTYLIAEDERNIDYTIYLDEYIGEDIFNYIYLMKRIDSHIVINPILVRRP